MPEAILELDRVEASYGPVPVVRGVSLTARGGEIVGLIGPNGAGKTTTLLTIMGVVPCAGGEIKFRGESIRGVRPEKVVRRGIALVPEGHRIFGDLTVAENLRLGLAGRPSPDGLSEDLEWIHGIFPVVNEFRDRPAGALSGGQQQQLAIARALIAAPQLLLLDEPSLGLAPSVVDDVLRALGEIRGRGVTMVLVEQRAQLIAGFADRTHVLNNGEIRTTLTPSEAKDTSRMIAAYFG
ncbi:MAG: ABC transporter ATP-binding protein [Solirubrobacterales bacterium]|nr:ABC transporter ATP-binding protein [Solirubrobacterales bacterium]MBV9797762.1 ABC transporter ATP-binding protein [Solirubrobacterales bacterium]